MAKTKEELKKLKLEYETLAAKLQELTEEELKLVTGGIDSQFDIEENEELYNNHIYPKKEPTFEPKY